MQFIRMEKLNLVNDAGYWILDARYWITHSPSYIQYPASSIHYPASSSQYLKILLVKLFKNISLIVKNKYVLTLAVFAVWMIFFDTRDIITTHFKLRNELKQLEESRNYYFGQIETTKKELEQLKLDPATLEKYAREKYRMKKDNEDLFIVSE